MTAATLRLRLLAVAVVVPIALSAGCAGPSSGGTSAGPTTSSTGASQLPYYSVRPPLPGTRSGDAVELAIPSGLGRLLAAAKGRADHVPAREYDGMNPQSPLHLARDGATGAVWAAGQVRARRRFMSAEISANNDAGSYDLFERKPGGVWTASDIGPSGQPAGFLCHLGLPNDVIGLWHWPLCLSGVS